MKNTGHQVAIITGGTTGIGLATARTLAMRGVRVILGGRDAARGEAAAADLVRSGASAVFVPCDVRREADVASLVERATERFGGVDLMFNNAGIEGRLGFFTELAEDDLDEVLATNVKGVLLGMKHALRVMLPRGRGVIVNTASVVGTLLSLPFAPVYGPSKAAVLAATRSAAAGCSAQGVRVYAVCPYMTDTPMTTRLTGGDPATAARFASLNPSGTIAEPADVAEVVTDMLFAPTRFESGAAVVVDRGGPAGLVAAAGLSG
jgi:NAD(P)-dependent dehydrogenase (short-subunit alcohol dehydrogenase family)